jgi:hypothetical protein
LESYEHRTDFLFQHPGTQATLFAPAPKAAKRLMECFTARINNDHTRKVHMNATRRFAPWCDGKGIRQLADVGQPRKLTWRIAGLKGRGGSRGSGQFCAELPPGRKVSDIKLSQSIPHPGGEMSSL